MGHPIWKYRVSEGQPEAKLFPNSDDIPEGWHDSPDAAAQPVEEVETKRGPGRPRKIMP